MRALLRMAFVQNLTSARGDHRSTLHRRMRNDTFAVANLGPLGAKVAAARFVDQKLVLDNVMFLPSDGTDYPAGLNEAIKERAKNSSVVIGWSFKARFDVQKFDAADVMAIGGGGGDTRDGNVHVQTIPSADNERTLRGAFDRSMLGLLSTGLGEAGVEIVRVEVPPMSLINRALADPRVVEFQARIAIVLLVSDQGMLHALPFSRAGRWLQPRATPIVRNYRNRAEREEQDALREVLLGCRKVIEQQAPRESDQKLTTIRFCLLDTGTPTLGPAITQILGRFTPGPDAPTMEIMSLFDGPHPDLLALCTELRP